MLLTILICVLVWKRFRHDIKAYVITTWLLLFAYICFYAKYTIWSGDFAWLIVTSRPQPSSPR